MCCLPWTVLSTRIPGKHTRRYRPDTLAGFFFFFCPSFFSSFFLSLFSVFAFSLFHFVFSSGRFRLFLVWPYSLFFSLPCFPWWRILLYCYFVSVPHPTRAPCEPKVCVPLRAVFFLAFLMLIYLTLFSISIWTSLFHPVRFLWILLYAVSSVSVSTATRLAYDMYLDTYYVRWSHLFIFCLIYDSFQLSRFLCFFFFEVKKWGLLPLVFVNSFLNSCRQV